MYSIRRFERIEDWLDAHADDPTACKAMSTWVVAAMTGPRQLANGGLDRSGRGYTLFHAVVPGTAAMVTYVVAEVPVRIMTIVSVIPWPD